MKKAVLFDIDGTLLDSYDFVFEGMKYSLTFHGHPYPFKNKIQQAMGKPLNEFYKVLFPDGNIESLAEKHREFQKDNFHLIQPFPKVNKILKELKEKGFLLAAISNRMRKSLIHSLEMNKILSFFDVILSAEDVANPKPHKEHVLAALKTLKVKQENAFMVGDTDEDIKAGQNAGVKTVGVTYGFLGEDIKKYKPDYVIDSIEELLGIIGN